MEIPNIRQVRRDVIHIYIDVLDRLERGVNAANEIAEERRDILFLQNLGYKIELARSFANELEFEHDHVAMINLFTAMDVISSLLQEGNDLPIARRFFGRVIGAQL